MNNKGPVVLIIMDGWGVTAPSVGNAVTNANLKYWDYLLKNYPTTLLQASGAAVGLPWGKMGNSEVGHLTIGTGQIYSQSLEKINKAISNGSFFQNQAFLKAINHVKNNNSNLHLIGLLGDGGVHAHQGHLVALLEMAAQNGLNNNTFLHLFTDGRDTARDSGLGFMEDLIRDINKLSCCQVASVGGRFYGMDRNNNWDRIKKSFATMVGTAKITENDPVQAIKNSYAKKIFDEEMEPVMIVRNGQPVGKVADNDAIIFFNFRADRARQLSHAFLDDEFKAFARGEKLKNLLFVGFTEYEKGLPMEVAFLKPQISHPLARIVSEAGLRQLHVAETEKYAHITFFLNGLRQKEFQGEDRVLIPSPSVLSYDKQPEMSAYKIRDAVVGSLEKGEHDFIAVNFANPDMVGHTGNLNASQRAVETVSECLESVVEIALKRNGQVLVTADHGNVEEIINLETREIDKEHSNFPVPCVLVNNEFAGKGVSVKNEDLHMMKIKGALVDIAPTLLAMIGLPKHEGMIGIDLQKVL